MRREALLTSLTVVALAVPQTGATALDIADAMAMARQQSREVLAARVRAEAGASRLKQAKGYRLPQLSLQEIWMRTNNPAEVFALQLNQGRFSFDDFVASDPNAPDWLTNATTRFLMTLPLYTGGELAGRIDQAKLAAEAAELQSTWAESGAALAAAEAYIRLAQAREQVTLLERVLETVDAHVALAQAYTDQGMLVRSELLRAEVERSRIEDLLAEARGQARVAQSHLSFRLAADPSIEWELEPLGEPLPIDRVLEHWLAGVDARADLRSARLLLAAAEREIKVQRSALLPKLGVAARYDFFDDRPFGSNNESGALMAIASIDLFSGHRHRAARAAAEADYEAGQQQLAHFVDGARLEVRDAYERARSTRERFATAAAAQEAAAETERITAERFQQGVVKMIDLLDATTARQEAATRELVARAEAHLAALTLAVQAGQRPEDMLAAHQAIPPRSES